ncbi:MAG: transposase [Verrucomicrobia bacterium]|nr:transposase [Verrucomicrobiota bacterium]
MGWTIVLTNVPRAVWPAKALAPLYRLRWRSEMIFKAWKSHLGLHPF